jgi:acyl-CoA synthetase (AMP-forming)/AMP-acid ligase II
MSDANAQIAQALDRLREPTPKAHGRDLEANWTSRSFLPDPTLTFPEVFARRAAQHPAHSALNVVSFVGREPQALPLSFGELSVRTQKAAAMLFRRGVRARDRVVLSVADPGVFFAFLVGAQSLGAIPVPVPGVAELPQQAYSLRLRSVIRDALPYALVLENTKALTATDMRLLDGLQVLDATHVDEISSESVAEFSWSRQPHEIAFLQYTSGSTGDPKGVVVLHRNLTSNLRAMIEALQIGPTDRIYSWLPLFHDMGLIAGLLMGIFAGIPAYVASPRHFVARPDSWLRGISRFQATFSPAPNFAYNVLARRVPDTALQGIDLKSWRLACDGAEPIDAETAQSFVRRFASFGFREKTFRAVYGLAECTLAASIPELQTPTSFDCVDRGELAEHGIAAIATENAPNAVTFVGVGKALPGHTIRIVEPGTNQDLPERRLGEIQVRGPSVTPFHFQQLLAGAQPRDALHTGDLGYIADGQLYVVDRLKDILIIGGRKFAPHDVEHVVAAIPGVRRGAVVAFASCSRNGTDELIVALALDPRVRVEPDSVVRAVRSSVHSHFGVTPADIVLIRPGDIPRTSSGKLARGACRSMYEGNAWAPPIPVSQLEPQT